MGVTQFPQQGTIGTALLPKRYDISIYQGDTFKVTLNLTDETPAAIDLTGFVGKAQFRNSAGVFVRELTVTIPTPASGQIIIDAGDTNTLAEGEYKWDLELTDPDDNVRTLIGGLVTVIVDITEIEV